MANKEISPEQTVQDLINRSGHNLHVQVANFLSERGYQIDISPYYVDAFTEKPRELDIIATKPVPLYEHRNSPSCLLIFAIDCKYTSEPSVFWMFENKRPHGALKSKEADATEIIRLCGEQCFSYFTVSQVARLFQSSKNGADDPVSDWMFKACNQAINGTIFAREHAAGSALIYPVVVVGGPGGLYDARNPSEPMESVLVHIDFSYPSRTEKGKDIREPFYVLVTRQENLDILCSHLEKEVDALRIYERDLEDEKTFRRHAEQRRVRQRTQDAQRRVGM